MAPRYISCLITTTYEASNKCVGGMDQGGAGTSVVRAGDRMVYMLMSRMIWGYGDCGGVEWEGLTF